CDLIRAATVVAAHGPMAGLVSQAADVAKVQLPWPQAQPMRLTPLRQPAAGRTRLNFFTWRGTWHRFPNIGPIKRYSLPYQALTYNEVMPMKWAQVALRVNLC